MPPEPPGAADAAPYAGLTPHCILDRLEDLGLAGDGRLLQLNSYENRVVQAGLEDGGFVVLKFYRPGRWTEAQILEEHAFAAELAAAEVPVVPPMTLHPLGGGGRPQDTAPLEHLGTPPTLARRGPLRWAVSPRAGGRAPELDDPAVLRRIGHCLGRLHAVGRRQPFRHRPRLDLARLGEQARATVLASPHLPRELAARWQATVDALLDRVRERFAAQPGLRWLRAHGDCHPGNLLWTEAGGPHFVDLDDCGTAPAVQDLWMLLPGDEDGAAGALAALLEGYEAFCDFDPCERRLIEPLRSLRLIHHSAWLAQRWADPAFPAAFPWFDSPSYWAQQVMQLQEQVERLDEGR